MDDTQTAPARRLAEAAIDRRDAETASVIALVVDMLSAMHWTDHDVTCPQYCAGPTTRPDDYGEGCWACSVMRRAHKLAREAQE